ncbi:unnamed protein product [Miscanthus lutarioriparius]|uniref:Uncharacterized protein n=1 Tax=Miscanthus lutarioriparius TaxID=422564 RepID=A0A811PSG9_9POAL|nr:unnamed protein product [Miscanthus lutarioriparius]
MTASARVLRLLPRQLTMPLRLAFTPPSRAAARSYFLMLLQQQPHRCWARAAASSASNSSSICEQYPQALIAAAPGRGATCPRDGKGDGDGEAAARGGEKAAGAQQDDSSCAAAPSPRAPKEKEALRAAAAAGRNGRSGATSRQRVRTAKPQPKLTQAKSNQHQQPANRPTGGELSSGVRIPVVEIDIEYTPTVLGVRVGGRVNPSHLGVQSCSVDADEIDGMRDRARTTFQF